MTASASPAPTATVPRTPRQPWHQTFWPWYGIGAGVTALGYTAILWQGGALSAAAYAGSAALICGAVFSALLSVGVFAFATGGLLFALSCAIGGESEEDRQAREITPPPVTDPPPDNVPPLPNDPASNGTETLKKKEDGVSTPGASLDVDSDTDDAQKTPSKPSSSGP